MDEDQKPTTLRDLEIDFLKEQLNGFSVEGDYCFGYFEGNKAEMDNLLVSFQALNSYLQKAIQKTKPATDFLKQV